MKTGPIAHGCGDRDHRAVCKTCDHSAQCAFHSRHCNDAVGFHDPVPLGKQSVDARHTEDKKFVYTVHVKAENEKKILKKVHSNNVMSTNALKWRDFA